MSSPSTKADVASALLRVTHDDDIEDIYEDSGVSTPLLEMKAASEDEAMRPPSAGEQVGLPSHTRDTALRFLRALCRNIGSPGAFVDTVPLLDAYCARAADKAHTSLAATCMAIVKLLFHFSHADESLDLQTMVDGLSVAALSAAGHPCVINDLMIREVKSRQVCLFRKLNCNVNLPSLMWWVRAYARRLELSIQSEFHASLGWATMRSMQSASSIILLRSLVGQTVPRHIAAGLLAVNIACAGLIAFDDLRPEGVGIVQWHTMFLQSRLNATIPVPRLSKNLAKGMLNAVQEVCACGSEDMRIGSSVALECICAVLIAQSIVAAPAV